MNINLFIVQKNIMPADAIILRKKFFGMLDHYVIYLGTNTKNNEHQFVANYVDGVKIVPNDEIHSLLQVYVPSDIDRFPGKESERPSALQRAWSRIGEKAYNIVSNNCEHFKNWVHLGIETSSQVGTLGGALTIGGLGLTLLGAGKKNKTTIVWGVIILLIGILVATFANRDKEEEKNSKLLIPKN